MFISSSRYLLITSTIVMLLLGLVYIKPDTHLMLQDMLLETVTDNKVALLTRNTANKDDGSKQNSNEESLTFSYPKNRKQDESKSEQRADVVNKVIDKESLLVRNLNLEEKTTISTIDLAEVIQDFVKKQDIVYEPLAESVEEEILDLFRYLDKNKIEIDHVEDDPKRKKRVVIMTAFHSGSTFTGRLFRENSEVFYMYEPLILTMMDRNWKEPRMRQNETNLYLQQLLECNLHPIMDASMKYYPTRHTKRNDWCKRIFPDSRQRGLGYDDENEASVTHWINTVQNTCMKNFSFTAIKSIRVDSIASIFPLLASGVKVIQLIRDPRGLANSRFRAAASAQENIDLMGNECSKNARNLRFLTNAKEIKTLHYLLMKNFRIIRFEDLCYSTLERCEDMFHFVGLEMTEQVRDFIIKYSSFTEENPADPDVDENKATDVEEEKTFVSDKSKSIASKWRLSQPFDTVRKYEDVCETTMNVLGFKILKTEMDYKNETIDMIVPIEKLPYVFG